MPENLIWYKLLDGQPYKCSNFDAVSLSRDHLILHFRDAVYQKCAPILNGLISSQLIVFKNLYSFSKRNAIEEKEEPLEEDLHISGFGKSKNEAVIVVVPAATDAHSHTFVRQMTIQDYYSLDFPAIICPTSAPSQPASIEGQIFERKEISEFVKFISSQENGVVNYKRIRVSGRRRIGKSFAIKTAAIRCHNSKRYVVFIEASKCRIAFIEMFASAFRSLLPSVEAPAYVSSITNCISWLLCNGVSVVIDEFQDLRVDVPDVAEGLKSEFEKKRAARADVNVGVLIVMGSNISEMNACFNHSAPLHLQGFYDYQFKPLTHVDMLRFLKQFHDLTPSDRLFYTMIANGRIGVLSDLSSSELFPIRDVHDFPNLMPALKNLKDYALEYELGPDIANPLLSIYRKNRWIPVDGSVLEKSASMPLTDLISYGFLNEFKRIAVKSESKSKYGLRDANYFLAAASNSIQEIIKLEGFLLELCVAEYFSRKGFNVICDSYWQGKRKTEIDLVAKSHDTVIWGSCKRNYRELNVSKLAAHVALFHAQRCKNNNEVYPGFKHEFVMFSLEMEGGDDKCSTFDGFAQLTNSQSIQSFVKKHLNLDDDEPFPKTMSLPATSIPVVHLGLDDISQFEIDGF